MDLHLLPLADFGDVAPLFPAVLFLMIPIIALLTSHQRKMAEILHRRGQGAENDARVLEELAALRQLVAQQSLMLDDLSRRQDRLTQRIGDASDVRDRLKA